MRNWLFGRKAARPADDPADHADPNVPVDPTPSPTSPGEAEHLDMAIDTFGAVLREYADQSFDAGAVEAGATRSQFQRWAMHIQYGAPFPDETVDQAQQRRGRRYWAGVLRAFGRHRRAEREAVVQAISDLQDAAWTFVRGFKDVVLDGAADDERAREHMDRLHSAVVHGSTEEIRREATSAVSNMREILATRHQQRNQQAQALHERIEQLGSQLNSAREETMLDPLTRLHNRRGLELATTRTLELHELFGSPSCLMVLDVDHFKRVNDTYGHPAGDAVLSQLADRLSLCFPRKHDFVARYGGEEFVIIVHDTTLRDGMALAERVLTAVRDKAFTFESQEIPITVSIGAAEIRPKEEPEDWLKRADKALFRAKNAGRDRAVPAADIEPTILDGGRGAAPPSSGASRSQRRAG